MYQVTQWVISSPPVLICPPPHLHQWHITLPVCWNQLELSGCEHERQAYCFLSLQVYLMHVTSYVWVPFNSTGSASVSAGEMVRHRDILICAGFMRHSSWHCSLSTTPMGSARIYRFVSTPCCFHVRSKPNYVWMQITAQTYVYLHLKHI